MVRGPHMRASFLLLVALSAFGTRAQEPGTVQLVATYRGHGGQFASTVAPGPTPGSEWLYASYLYLDDTFEVAAIDPGDGTTRVYPSPVKGEYGARCMITGPDGTVYLGTLPKAHFVKLDTKQQRLVDLGQPSATEQYIWDVTFGSDGKLYGSTYPNAKLVSYDPKTGRLEDLGRMDDSQQYAHYIAASRDGFVYTGIGTARMNVVAYSIAKRERKAILPDAFRAQGQASVYEGADGEVYAVAGNQRFRLNQFSATPIDAKAAASPRSKTLTHDGRVLAVRDHDVLSQDRKTGKEATVAFDYPGRELPIFRVGFGPDGRLYASTMLPGRLLRLNEREGRFEDLGPLGNGEVYAFLAHDKRLLMAAYASRAPLMVFDPERPFNEAAAAANPVLVTYKDDDEAWRPSSLVNGPDGKAYVGARPGYGKLGGVLCAWDVASGTVEQHKALVKDQSISALAVWKNTIVAGTSIVGGMGSTPTQKDTRIFLWDVRSKALVWDMEPFPGVPSIENLVTSPNGLVYGTAGNLMFVFDPEKRAMRYWKKLPFAGGAVYGSMGVGPDGRVWGVGGDATGGVFVIDPATNEVSLAARAPKAISGGFGFAPPFLYFTSGGSLYRYRIPPGRSHGAAVDRSR
jgi:streptogramin lyase